MASQKHFELEVASSFLVLLLGVAMSSLVDIVIYQ